MEINNFWNDLIDVPMCSDMCPCSKTEFELGRYHLMSNDELASFARSSVSQGEGDTQIANPNAISSAGQKMPLFTEEALIDYLGISGNNA